MTALLLDTHVALWWLSREPLTAAAAGAIAAPENVVTLSIASCWEIAIKQGLGRLQVPLDYVQVLAAEDIGIRPIEVAHAAAVRDLPSHHRDPFDRMLVAQARAERLILVTRDERLKAYDVEVLDA